ncbi:hypothetical protein CYLTODRAFT_427679 [Cylindrobasidium torrendii FP15055 ss-10]|uniref:Uncharacterized protein n=1 Tax=Cylindrobasidium torrendii FP15055 ss-10 TaxID=1314674 RepID=A0A0D7ASB2_9AGAR|nr:hypothetical protein CYLTODRAFT_427679 [Cylindrobasidium torrendii FP15055 ss-10]
MPRSAQIHGEWKYVAVASDKLKILKTKAWPLLLSEAEVSGQTSELAGRHMCLRLFVNKGALQEDVDCVVACLTAERKTASMNVTIPAFSSFSLGCDGVLGDKITVMARFISYDLIQ